MVKDNLFGSRLKELREEKCWPQEYLKTRLERHKGREFHKQIISNYERGIREPDIDTLVFFSRDLGASLDYLLGKSDYRTASHEVIAKEYNLNPEIINLIFDLEVIKKIQEQPLHLKQFLFEILKSNNFYGLLAALYNYKEQFPKIKPEPLFRLRTALDTDYEIPEDEQKKLKRAHLIGIIDVFLRRLLDELEV